MMHRFGTYISKLRLEKGFSKEELSANISVPTELLDNIEKNLTIPSKELFNRLKKIFGAESEWLMALYLTEKWYEQLSRTPYAGVILDGLTERTQKENTVGFNDIIEKVVEYLHTMPIKKAWVFGSFARNEADNDSDLDIMVRYKQPKLIDLFDITEYIVNLEKLTGKKVDLVEEGYETDFARESILNERKLIYERKTTG